MIGFYTRYLTLAQAASLPVDLTAKRLLELIVMREAKGNLMTVTEAMNLVDLASPATLHRKLDDLLDAKLIDHEFEGRNRRTKYLVTTQKARAHFSKLGMAIAEAGGAA